MVSSVSICNLALARVGEGGITSLSGTDAVSRTANNMYEFCRDALLRSYRWKFAIRRASIGASLEAPMRVYSYAYEVPSDCLRVLAVNEDDPELQDVYQDPRWDIEGTQVVTNEPGPIEITYIARVTDEAQFDASFVRVLVCELAARFAPVVSSNGRGLVNDIMEERKDFLREARYLNSISGKPVRQRFSVPTWVR